MLNIMTPMTGKVVFTFNCFIKKDAMIAVFGFVCDTKLRVSNALNKPFTLNATQENDTKQIE